ncbi:hypothetical protein VTK26DRAFT_4511 [Humicola hyalothermophila]
MSSFQPYRPGPRGLRIQSQDYVEDTRRKRDPAYGSLMEQIDREIRAERRAATMRASQENEHRREVERQRERDRRDREWSSRLGPRSGRSRRTVYLDFNSPLPPPEPRTAGVDFDINDLYSEPLPPPPPSPRPAALDYGFDDSPSLFADPPPRSSRRRGRSETLGLELDLDLDLDPGLSPRSSSKRRRSVFATPPPEPGPSNRAGSSRYRPLSPPAGRSSPPPLSRFPSFRRGTGGEMRRMDDGDDGHGYSSFGDLNRSRPQDTWRSTWR